MIVGEVKAGRPQCIEFYRERRVVEVWLPRIRVNRRRTLPVQGDSPSGLQECATREEAVQWAKDFAANAMREAEAFGGTTNA
ncbi:MAG: hypothetical protein M0Z66_16100 [Thermaerobacter sp.]|nr:hypothetical protein [Thermaerobacter sp.]